jgi:hypothetical protein
MRHIPFVTILLALLLSACAPATPTTDPAQIQASAVAAANTMVALTQAAIPTETPIPPTALPSPTPLPSPTLLALPTLSIATLPTQASQGGGNSGGNSGGSNNTSGDPCQAPMTSKPAGPQITVRIVNETKGAIVLSLYLSKNDFGECGYRSFNLDNGGSATTTLPTGCYFGGAFVNDPKKASKAFGSGCFQGTRAGLVTVSATLIRISQ